LLKAGVKLYGGFAGGETARSARNPAGNATILSGDFSNDDTGDAMGGFSNMDENAYHVVLGVNIPDNGATVLDGFTIRGGNANDTTYSSITVGGKGISRYYGGGIFNYSSSPVLTGVTISGNQARNSGGGMYNYNSSSPVLTGVTISGNRVNNSTSSGGGMFNLSSSPVLTNVTISGNQTNGGVYGGGGMYNDGSSPVLTYVTISGNQANGGNDGGGGMFNTSSSSPVLTNVTISGNRANWGGGMYNRSSSPVLTNVTISGNQANYNYGGGMDNDSSSPQIRNSIIWGNGTSNVYNSGTPSYTYSLVEGENPSGTGNLDGTSAGNDPLFVSPEAYTSAPSTAGNYRLQAGSPAIDAGSDSFYNSGTPDLSGITTDLDGHPRFNGTVDMGAYELQ
jgi:hypothetical protein